MPEHIDKVKEQVKRVSNVIFATHSVLLNNKLCVVDDKSTHYNQAKVKMNLVDQLRSEEDVGQ